MEKFIAFQIPYELAEQRYGGHFAVVKNDLGETDDLQVFDYNGERTIKLFRFDALGKETRHESVNRP